MGEKRPKKETVIRSIADEIKKVAYLGAAGPYVIMGDKGAVDGATLVAIALIWFLGCQSIAHFLLALADRLEVEND